jgi:tetratricopeptide (TPR) repeat protein
MTIKGLAHQAWAWMMADRIQDSFGLCQRLFELRSRRKDAVHADTLAAVGILASSLETAAESEKGRKPLEFLRYALALKQSFFDEEEASSLAVLKKLAKLLTIFAETKEAEALFRQQLAICRRIFGEEHQRTAQACHELADFLYEKGSFSESSELCQTACSLREILLGRDDLETGRSYKLLGLLRGATEQYADAVTLLKSGLVILEKNLRPEHCEVYRTYREIATCCRMLHEFDEAVDWQKKALLNCQTAQSDQSVEFGVYCQDMARIYLAMKNLDEAQSWAEKSHELIKQDNELFALHLLFMANMANLQKRLAEGLGYADQALFLFQQEKQPNQLYIALCYDELAMLHYERGQLDKALELAKTAADTLTNNGMSETRYANSVSFHLAFLQDRKNRLG